MRTAGIICEYNPFHTGHKHQVDILHGMGYDCVASVMSGNYTQRGELAIFDKYTRAKAAVLGGSDIVLELPFPFSSLSAEGFAAAGVHILASLGVDTVCFGSECGDIEILENAANAVISPDFPEIYSRLSKSRLGSASAYFESIKQISGVDASLLSNDILGISYIAAIKRNNYKINALTVKREGAAYNETELKGGVMPSASAIRKAIYENNTPLDDLLLSHVPSGSISAFTCAKEKGLGPVCQEGLREKILSFFKLMTARELSDRAIFRSQGGEGVAEDGCGICERLCSAARRAKSYDEFLSLSRTSKYTDARIDRVILFSLFGVSDKMSHSLPKYTTLLAASAAGREFLAMIRKLDTFTVITKPADAPETLQKALSEAADALYASAIPNEKSPDHFIKSRPFML